MHKAATALIIALAAPAAQAQGSFCMRMAEQSGMTPERTKTGQPRQWSMRTLNLAQRFLVGGSTMVSMAVAPIEGSNAASIKPCHGVGKSLVCEIEGPAELQLGVNGKDMRVRAAAGEKADVAMIGTRITCSDR